MTKWLFACIFPLLLALSPSGARAQFGSFGDVPIEINAEDTRFEAGVAVAEGNVVIQYGETTIYADHAEYNPDTRDVLVRGNVRIYREPATTAGAADTGRRGNVGGGQLFVGERAVYNLETKKLTAADFRGDFFPFKFAADTFSTAGANAYTAKGAVFTTSDSSKPDYFLRAKSVRIYPKDRVVFSNVTLYIGRTPVFWFPYVYQSLNRESAFSATPGYRSSWGAFLLAQYHFPITTGWAGKLRLDLRSERGIAGGLDTDFKYGKEDRSWGRFRTYVADDLQPPVVRVGGGPKGQVDPTRYRISLQHRLYITDDIYANIDINKLSDARVYEDFLPNEFRVDPQPDNVFSLTKIADNYTASLIYRKQLNDFFNLTERLPEFVFDFKRHALFDSPIYYEGETGVAQLRRNFVKDAGLENYRATRLDSFHQFLYPQVYGGWLSVIPRIGLRGTFYSDSGAFETTSTTTTVEDLLPDNTIRRKLVTNTESRLNHDGTALRGVLSGGLEASFKFSREWDNVQSRVWGLNDLRHVAQPYTDLSLAYSTKQPGGILQFDRFQRSTQLPIFDFPEFTSTDTISSWAVWRVGMRNRLQTRRDNATFNWLELDTFFNVNLAEPQFPGADFQQGTLSNLYNRLRFNPLPWVALNIDSQTPLGPHGFTQLNTALSFLVNEDLRLDVGHRYIDNNPFFENSNVVSLGGYYRVGDNWSFSLREEYEFADHTLETQSYQVHRDLSSWVASLGLVVRDSRNGPDEYAFLLSFTLKDLPAISVPLNLDPQGQGTTGKNK